LVAAAQPVSALATGALRCHAAIQSGRSTAGLQVIFRFADFELDAERRELRRAGKLVPADALVVRLLIRLVREPDRLVTKDELVEDVWEGRSVADNAITVSVARLRKTLGDGRSEQPFITTIYGRGYRFVRDVIVAERGARVSNAPARTPHDQPPFVGRQRLLTRLQHALNGARSGQGRACVLIGEPGIGKTRSVEALESEVKGSQLRVAWGYCRQGADTPPLSPWLRLLREVVAGCSLPDLKRALGPSVTEVLELCEAQTVPPVTSGLAPGALLGPRRHQGFAAIVRAFAFAAEQTPWLLVLDDLHRADDGSLELFSYLLDEIPRTRIFVVATLRPTSQAESLLAHVVGHRNTERIVVERLREEDVKTYVAALLDDANGTLGHAVFSKSEGNPFFMTELSRQLCDSEHPEARSLEVPDAALDLIWQRIAKLDHRARGVLSAAAVIGRSFELPLLQLVTGSDLGSLMSCLDEALATDVIVAAPDSVTAFGFGHELLRVALYDALTTAERRRWHTRIANALDERQRAGEAVAPSDLAYHFHAALPESDARKTVEYCRAAATAAADGFASSDVARYLRHALEALGLVENASGSLRMMLLYTSMLYTLTSTATRRCRCARRACSMCIPVSSRCRARSPPCRARSRCSHPTTRACVRSRWRCSRSAHPTAFRPNAATR
jgi:DNA-binding winged helix-turn-helix (wHTH) protein